MLLIIFQLSMYLYGKRNVVLVDLYCSTCHVNDTLKLVIFIIVDLVNI